MATKRCCCIPFLSFGHRITTATKRCCCIPAGISQCGEAQSSSSGLAKDGAPQCVKESVAENVDRASSSSSGVIKQILDWGVYHCGGDSSGLAKDAAPQCVKESVAENVDGAPHCDEASSSSSAVIKKAVIKKIRNEGENAEVNLEDLMQHITELLSLIEQENRMPHKYSYKWPGGSDWKKLTDLLSSGISLFSELKDVISGTVRGILKGIGKASLATAGLLVVAYSLERFDEISGNNKQCLKLLKEMSKVAKLVKTLSKIPKEMENEIEDATSMIVKGAIMCCTQMDSSPWKSFLTASKTKEDLTDTKQDLLLLYTEISAHCGVLNVIQRNSKSPLSREYPTHAVGIRESIKEVLRLLDCESERNAVTVILHGFGGTGKSTLADAVFSQIEGYEYSKVRLFESISSTPDIKQLQKTIIEHLGPEEPTPNFVTYEDGQRELEKILKNVQAFIYIDNVLDGDELKKLLPPDIDTAKKVRFLLTARDEHVKIKCPRSGTKPKIYPMKDIELPQAKLILEKEIREGLNASQFNDLIQICGGIPLMLTLAAPFIGRADDKKKAYDTLKRQGGKWESGEFKPMHYAFAYTDLPPECKDPLHDICSFFKGWDWATVEDIVGEDELERLRSRALVTKARNGVVTVHDVIFTLSCEISKESEGKEVRRTFNTASELKDFLQDPEETRGIKGIKGMWASDINDIVDISASALDLMSNSLRVLQLGDSRIKVEGNCTKIFTELIFLKAKINSLPFFVPTQLPQLRYLNYEPNDLKLSKMPSSLRHVDFIGTSHTQDFRIFATDLHQLRNLRVIKLTDFKLMENLPRSISELQFLRKLEMVGCSSLRELPPNLGSLSSLQELNLRGCSELETLPNSVEELSSLTLLNLSSCRSLVSLPPGLGNLTRLAELNLNECAHLQGIPESIRELKLLRTLGMSLCWKLRELPHLGNLSFITHLSLTFCWDLKKLPDGFGQLANLRVLDLSSCHQLEKLPQGFGQLKSLEDLVLSYCVALKELCDDFHCLSSLKSLDLIHCVSLNKLTEGFVCLSSLQHLNLRSCDSLEGKWMDHIVKMNRLQFVDIKESANLVEMWEEIQRDGDRSWSCEVFTGQNLPEVSKENIEKKLLAQFDRLLTNGQGQPFHLSDLLRGTPILLLCDVNLDSGGTDGFPWPLIEETMDEIRIIYIGPYFDELPAKVKDGIFVCRLLVADVSRVVTNMFLTLDSAEDDDERRCLRYFQMRSKMVGDGKSDKYRPCWTSLTDEEMEEFLLGNSGRYLRLKNIVETRQSSNLKLLQELFAPEANETSPFFRKNNPSQQDQTENSEPFTCGVDTLEGKTIIFELKPADSCSDIRLGLWKEVYVAEKEKLNLEIISVPIVRSSMVPDVFNLYKKVATEVPWLVLQKSWMVITRAVGFFLAKHCGWEDAAAPKLYSSVIWLIEPNGRIMNYVKTPLNSLRSASYHAIKGFSCMREEIEELKKEEWKQLNNMSKLEFLFFYLKNVSDQIKGPMLERKMICLYGGQFEEATRSIWNAMKDLGYDILFIHVGQWERMSLNLTDILMKHYYYSFQKTNEIEEMSLSNLSGHEAAEFWTRLVHLKEEINEMDNNDKKVCELKTLLHSFLLEDWCMTLMDKDGKMIATCKGEIMARGTNRRKDRAKRLIKRLIKQMMKELEGGKETNDEGAAVEQEHVDVDLDSLSEYTSELLTEKLLYQFLKFNKGKKCSRPKVDWSTPGGLCMLMNFLSEGTNVNWVKDVIPRSARTITKKLIEGIGEAQWATARLLVVAHVLESIETVSTKADDWLLVLDDMFVLTQYIKQLNQRPEMWTTINRTATGWILTVSICLLYEIDPSKFAMIEQELMEEECEPWSSCFLENVGETICSPEMLKVKVNEGRPSCGGESGPSSPKSCPMATGEEEYVAPRWLVDSSDLWVTRC